MLSALAAAPALELHGMHIEHGIRPPEESRGDAGFVQEFCAKLGVPCRVAHIPPGRIAQTAKKRGLGIEAAARLYRYRALFRHARALEAGGNRRVLILTAHTRDDLLETALMRLLRGAGPAGLAAIPSRRGRLLRPMLGISRAEVLSYLAEKKLPWREESTTRDIRCLRNRVRHCLSPLLDESFPHWRSGLSAVLETQSLAAAFIKAEAARRVNWRAAGGGLCAEAENFFAQPGLIREEALFAGIDRMSPRGAAVRRKVLRTFSNGLVRAADAGPLRLRRVDELVTISAKKPRPSETGFALLIKTPGLYTLKKVTITVSAASDGEAPQGFYALLPLALRPALRDDRLESGARSGAKKRPQLAGGRKVWSAVDRLGVAAFISRGEILARREIPADDVRRESHILYRITLGETCLTT
jgi:tRNA(Ile)-lysidine synthase